MRILWSIHLYPPGHNCGAEYVAHHVNKYLISQGHEVRVLLLQYNGAPYIFDGVEVMAYPKHDHIGVYQWADIICTHLDYTLHTINIASIAKRPVFHFIHNSFKYSEIVEARDPQYIVYNSYWIAKKLAYSHKSTVLQPPCPEEYYRILGNPFGNKYITLSNLDENKGGEILYKLAQVLPHRQFLGIVGSYDWGGIQPQTVDKLKTLPNVTIMPHSSDPRQIYQQTKIMLMLSRYESWGRVVTEAMLNGIPVIHTCTDGVFENIQLAGLPIPDRGDRKEDKSGKVIETDAEVYDVNPICEHIKKLDDQEYYRTFQIAGLLRYRELKGAQKNQLYALEQLFFEAEQDFRHKRNSFSRTLL
jgi:glycosyltransferase involved in cell wall biosynthesis